jgi:DNA-binding MarR family transcriptional regulator
MTKPQARETAREILKIIPLVMRTVAAELRAAGEMPAPAHFGLLSTLALQAHTLTELARLQGVSLPTMSDSVTTMAQRGWVRRTIASKDRRSVVIEVTATGRAALDRVGRSAEAHLAVALAPLDATSRRRLQAGLGVLGKVFTSRPAADGRNRPVRAARAAR